MQSNSRPYKELLILIICLLIASALPALIAMLFGRFPIEREALSDATVLVYYSHEEADEPITLTLHELLVGTLAAYNASDTPIESMKAQAVALRSRAGCLVGYCREGDSLCDSPSHGLVCMTAAELESLCGKEESSARYALAEQAVAAVRNEILRYGDDCILALTHGASSGRTKAMEGYPYLVSVVTPESIPSPNGAEAQGYGLSRAGAAVYASQGLDYSEILLHYFPETTLSTIE